jgi:hypothetical protein
MITDSSHRPRSALTPMLTKNTGTGRFDICRDGGDASLIGAPEPGPPAPR